MNGVMMIAEERQRQLTAEGYTSTHDEEHEMEELAFAAATYALPSPYRQNHLWPDGWDFKPGPTRVRELVKAGALIAAEIDRLRTRETL